MCWLPSGKRLHNYGTSPFLMGKLTISMAIFSSYRYVKLPEGKTINIPLLSHHYPIIIPINHIKPKGEENSTVFLDELTPFSR